MRDNGRLDKQTTDRRPQKATTLRQGIQGRTPQQPSKACSGDMMCSTRRWVAGHAAIDLVSRACSARRVAGQRVCGRTAGRGHVSMVISFYACALAGGNHTTYSVIFFSKDAVMKFCSRFSFTL